MRFRGKQCLCPVWATKLHAELAVKVGLLSGVWKDARVLLGQLPSIFLAQFVKFMRVWPVGSRIFSQDANR